MTKTEKTVGEMAALFMIASRNRSNRLPIRYGVAARMLSNNPSLRNVAWSDALSLLKTA